MKFRHRRRSGFFLVDILAVMFALALCISVGTIAILIALKIDSGVETDHRRTSWRASLADTFRRDVDHSVSTPKKAGNDFAGPTTLILKIRDDERVIYQIEGAVVHRRETKTGVAQDLPLIEGTTAEFVQLENSLITLKLTEKSKTGVSHRLDITAALGGDRR